MEHRQQAASNARPSGVASPVRQVPQGTQGAFSAPLMPGDDQAPAGRPTLEDRAKTPRHECQQPDSGAVSWQSRWHWQRAAVTVSSLSGRPRRGSAKEPESQVSDASVNGAPRLLVASSPARAESACVRRTRRAPKFALGCGASRRAWYSDCVHESEIGSESESPRSRWLTTIPVVYCNAASPTRQVDHWQAPTRSPTRRPSECPSHSASQGGDWSSPRARVVIGTRSLRLGLEPSPGLRLRISIVTPSVPVPVPVARAGAPESTPARGLQVGARSRAHSQNERARCLSRSRSESRGPPSPQAQARDARTTMLLGAA
jgi:hypothetical protein